MGLFTQVTMTDQGCVSQLGSYWSLPTNTELLLAAGSHPQDTPANPTQHTVHSRSGVCIIRN